MKPLLLFHPPASYLQVSLRYPNHIPSLIRLRFPKASAEERELLFEWIKTYLLDESSEVDRITGMVLNEDLTSAIAFFHRPLRDHRWGNRSGRGGEGGDSLGRYFGHLNLVLLGELSRLRLLPPPSIDPARTTMERMRRF